MEPSVTHCIISRGRADAGGLGTITASESYEQAIQKVAIEVARDSRWSSRPDIAFVIGKSGSDTIFGAFGSFSKSDLNRIQNLADQFARAGKRSLYVDYRQAESDCEILAAKLKSRYEYNDLKRFSWYAIPRGGVVVLGMLSYALNLPSASIAPNGSPGAPTVVVDDCALSGLRFAQTLEQIPASNIIFAHLYSHPDLRNAIREREDRVLDCLSAHDLVDLAPESGPESYEKWKDSWHARLGDDVYWIGQPEYLCFAWNEPETSCWNAATEEIEPGWRLVPRERCLRSRSEIRQSDDTGTPRLQIQPAPAGPLTPCDQVLYAEMSEGRIAAALPGSDCFLMEDVAADMWRALVQHGAVKAAAASIAGKYEVDPQRLETDMQSFVEELREQGLVVRC